MKIVVYIAAICVSVSTYDDNGQSLMIRIKIEVSHLCNAIFAVLLS